MRNPKCSKWQSNYFHKSYSLQPFLLLMIPCDECIRDRQSSCVSWQGQGALGRGKVQVRMAEHKHWQGWQSTRHSNPQQPPWETSRGNLTLGTSIIPGKTLLVNENYLWPLGMEKEGMRGAVQSALRLWAFSRTLCSCDKLLLLL